MSIYTGTEGDDQIGASSSTDAINALGGNDVINLWSSLPSRIDIDGGAGDDTFRIQTDGSSTASDIHLTLGAGRDTLQIYHIENATVTVVDFKTGVGGDTIDLSYLLSQWMNGWDSHTNPFAAGGYFRLVQFGVDTMVQIDKHLNGITGNWSDFILLQNTKVGDFVASNFNGASPDGSKPLDQILQGGPDTDFLHDGWGNDQLYGGAGGDYLYGGAGDDFLDGGDGNDYIIDDYATSDQLYGGAGDDYMQHSGGMVLTASTVTTMNGGSGDDRLYYSGNYDYAIHPPGSEPIATANLIGGVGSDVFSISGTVKIAADGGAGDDIFQLMPGSWGDITFGAGRDLIWLYGYGSSYQYGNVNKPIHITDFATGMAGDRLDVSTYVNFTNWDGHTDLIALGYVAVNEIDGSTVITVRYEPGANTLATYVLDGVHLADLTLYNLTGLATNGSELSGSVIRATDTPNTDDPHILTGTANDDILISSQWYSEAINGGDGADRIEGSGGDDTLKGDGGGDVLIGGQGKDYLYGGAGGDTLDGGSGADYLYGGLGADTLEGDAGVDVFVVNAANESALAGADAIVDFTSGEDRIDLRGVGGDFIAVIKTAVGSDLYFAPDVTGAAQSKISTVGVVQGLDLLTNSNTWLYMEGGAGGDTLVGGSNSDMLVGQGGADKLTGGLGADQFIIRDFNDSTLAAADTITDFKAGTDRLVLGATSGTTVSLITSGLTTTVYYAVDANGGSRGKVNIQGDLKATDVNVASGAWFYVQGDGAANDLRGAEGNDILTGQDGNDVLTGGRGADTLIGGQGIDQFKIDAGTDSTLANADRIVDFQTGVDKLMITADAGATISLIRGASSTDVYFALDNAGASHSKVTADGVLQASDIETGSTVKYYIEGSAGADVLKGGANNDYIVGGAGGDTLTGGTGIDHFAIRNLQDSTLAKADLITDFVSAVDRLDLNFNAGSVLSLIRTATGTDIYFSLDGAGAAQGKITVASAVQGSDISTGSPVWFYMEGTANADILVGGSGNDIIKGGGGADRITGGSGADTLVGGAGSDVFVFNAGFGHDVIQDYTAADHMDIGDLSIGHSYTLTQAGADTLVTFDTGDVVQISNLTTDLFHF